MTQIKTVFLPLGRVNFHMESANDFFQQSVQMLTDIHQGIQHPNGILTSLEDLNNYMDTLENPELLIVQNTTFVDSSFIADVLRKFNCIILLWTVREPVIDGGRLRLNSLTGAFSAGNQMVSQGRDFQYVFGAPGEAAVVDKIKAVIKACNTHKSLKQLTIGVVGSAPAGFYFSTALDTEVQRLLGAKVAYIEVRDIINRAKQLAPTDYQNYIDETTKDIKELDTIPTENLDKYGRLFAAYKSFVKENQIGALASRCWPDFFTEYATPVCGVLSGLTEEGVAAACEADVYGSISMYILTQLTGTASYFGDPVSLDETKNSIIYWHCGAGACSLARQDTGAKAGVHPNRKIGLTLEFGLKEGRVTVIRLGRKPDGTFRMYLMGGEALDEPQKFLGTSVEVKTDNNAAEIINKAVKDGWEPHFALGYGDVREEIKVLCDLLQIEVVEY